MPSYQYSSKAYKARATPASKRSPAVRARLKQTKQRGLEHAEMRRSHALGLAERMIELSRLRTVDAYVIDPTALGRAADALLSIPKGATSRIAQTHYDAAQRELAAAFGLCTLRK